MRMWATVVVASHLRLPDVLEAPPQDARTVAVLPEGERHRVCGSEMWKRERSGNV